MDTQVVTAQRIEQFYKDYRDSISLIEKLDTGLLEQSLSYETWSGLLDEKSQSLRDIYAKNVNDYAEVIDSFVKHPENMDDEKADMFLKQISNLHRSGIHDYGVSVPILRVIISYSERSGNYLRCLDANYFIAAACAASNRFSEGDAYFNKVLSMCPDIDIAVDRDRQYNVLCAAFYRLLLYQKKDGRDSEVLLDYYTTAMKYWKDGVISGVVSPDILYPIRSVLRTITIYGIRYFLDDLSPELLKILEDEYEYQKAPIKGQETGCLTGVVYEKYKYVQGKITAEEYLNYLLEQYQVLSAEYKAGYTFGTGEFASMFADMNAGRDLETSNLFYTNPVCSFVYVLLPELLGLCANEEVRHAIYDDVHEFFWELPVVSGDGTVDFVLSSVLGQVLYHCPEEGKMLESIHNLLTHRQIATAIHSRMVGELAKMITDRLVTYHPTLFYGIGGLDTRSKVINSKRKLTHYIWRAGCLHDVGKIMCSDVINLQVRRIIDEEYEVIKTHALNGYNLLASSKALSKYADVAGSHHKFYDGSKGYPMDYRRSEGPERIFADIVSVCDVIDAAMDIKGRNYAKGKTFDELFEELKRDKGVRYSDKVIDAIEEDRALQLQINEFLGEGRKRIQYEVYRRFVTADTNTVNEDEMFMRVMREEDLPNVAKACGRSVADTVELYERCKDLSYLLLDRNGKLYGNIMCLSFGDTIVVMQLYVRRDSRRKGLGSMLMDHVYATAKKFSTKKIYMPYGTDDSSVYFGENRGFQLADRGGFMMRFL